MVIAANRIVYYSPTRADIPQMTIPKITRKKTTFGDLDRPSVCPIAPYSGSYDLGIWWDVVLARQTIINRYMISPTRALEKLTLVEKMVAGVTPMDDELMLELLECYVWETLPLAIQVMNIAGHEYERPHRILCDDGGVAPWTLADARVWIAKLAGGEG